MIIKKKKKIDVKEHILNLLIFFSRSFMVSGIHVFNLFLFAYDVKKISPNSLFCMQLFSFPTPFIKEAVFASLYIVAYLIID